MPASIRTVLVVEDDQLLSTFITSLCQEVLTEFSHIGGRIEQAFSYKQAAHALKRENIDVLSTDVALSKREEGLTNWQKEITEAGGISLLKMIQQAKRKPLIVVVSAEVLKPYITDAYHRYGVLAFYQKDEFDNRRYKNAVRAALGYLDTVDLIESANFEAASNCWEDVLQAAKIAGIQIQNFPEDLGDRISKLLGGETKQ